MISRDSFPGTQEQYIEFLENEISILRRHHETCAASSHQSFASAARSPQSPRLHLPKHNDGTGNGACNIILWEPDTVNASAGQREPEWKSHARKLLNATPKGESWWQAIEKAGLYETMSEGKAATFLLDQDCSSAILAKASDSSHQGQPHCRISSRLRSYALSSMHRNASATMALKLINFQQFLLLSACAVLRTTRQVCMESLVDIVKICIGCKSERYSMRILDTVMWMNKLVDALNVKGWNNRAPELLLLCQSSWPLITASRS